MTSEVRINDLTFLFRRSLKGRCYGNQYGGQIFIARLHSSRTFHNGANDRNANGCVNNGVDSSTCKINLVSFNPVTPEFTRLECVQ